MKFKMVIIVEGEDDSVVDTIWDAAASESYDNPDIIGIEFVSAVEVDE